MNIVKRSEKYICRLKFNPHIYKVNKAMSSRNPRAYVI